MTTVLSFVRIARAAMITGLLTIAQIADAQTRIKFSPPPPPDRGDPLGRGQGGGKRGDCEKKFAGLTALVPTPHADVPDNRWGLTVSARPTVWFDVPTGIESEVPVQWRLRDAAGKTIYKTVRRIPPTKPGVISFSLPATVPPLRVGTYQWDLAVYCDNTIDIPAIRKGRVQRISTPQALQQEITSAKTPLQQANSYAKYGVWYDALTTLGTQIRTSRQNDPTIVGAWSELLRQQKLDSNASATLTPCCTP
jgi:hypothetical protein